MLLKENTLYEFEEFVLDTSERTLRRENKTVSVTPKAIETLCLLVESHGKLLSKDDLMNALWADTFVEERNLAQNIFTLRKILGENVQGKKFIETVPRRGYRFVAEVRPIDSEREEFIEVSLEKQTTIKAEGNVSSRDLTEAVRETAKSLALEKDFEENKIKQIETSGKLNPFFQTNSLSFLSVGIFSVVAAGILFWFWSGNNSQTQANSFSSGSEPANIKLQRLTDSGKTWNPAISPDERQIAYVFRDRNQDSIRLQNLATGSITETVPPDKSADYGRLLFSKDGNYLFYHSRDGGKEGAIYQTPIYGGFSRLIAENVRSDFSLSPDGEWFAFFRYDGKSDETRLIICRTDSSGEKVIAARKGKLQFDVWEVFPAWSPDGKKLVAAAMTQNTDQEGEKNREYFVEINLSDGAEKQIPAPEFYKTGQPLWMPDGKSLIVLAQEKAESPLQIWHISYPDGAAKRITNDLTNYFRINLSPNGDFLLVTERKNYFNIWTIDAENPAQPKQLTSNTNIKNGSYGLMWTPDAKQIIYSQTEGLEIGNIWSIDVETQQTKQLTTDKGKLNWFPVVTPDGSSIIFASNRSGNWHLWQMNLDGSNLRQITDGIGESFPQISPDGNWLIYVTSGYIPHILWKKPLNGNGEAVKLLEYAGGPAHISPDSQQIAVHSSTPEMDGTNIWRYIIIPMQGGEPVYITDLDPERAIVRWKTDGSGFYYLRKERDYNNIWFYSLEDGKSVQVTGFDQLKIVNMSLSPDGKQFAVSRGAMASEIIKITGF